MQREDEAPPKKIIEVGARPKLTAALLALMAAAEREAAPSPPLVPFTPRPVVRGGRKPKASLAAMMERLGARAASPVNPKNPHPTVDYEHELASCVAPHCAACRVRLFGESFLPPPEPARCAMCGHPPKRECDDCDGAPDGGHTHEWPCRFGPGGAEDLVS